MFNLPDTDSNVVVCLSGGLDSSILAITLVEKYGKNRVHAIGFDYGQKQVIELSKARTFCKHLEISHNILDLSVLGNISSKVSANIQGTDIKMPNIEEVLGDPQPVTYVPFRNLILLSLTLSYAETIKASHVFTGLQVHDEYGYWDTTQRFVDGLNNIAEQNRLHQAEIVAPFSELSKYDELQICKDLNKLDLLKHTITCYNPDIKGRSCGICPSCSERINAFIKSGLVDPIEYQIDIDWNRNV